MSADDTRARVAQDIQGWDAIADHRTGTPGDKQTADWLASNAVAAGASPSLEVFQLSRWVLRRCVVQIGANEVTGVPLFDGGTTGPEGATAPLVRLPDSANGIGLGAIGAAAGSAANRALAEARRGNRPAIVAVAKMNADVPGLALQNADHFSAPFGPPVLQVASEHEAWLRSAAAEGATAQVVVEVEKREASAYNVAVRVAGVAPGSDELPPLAIVTPKSSWWTSTAERGGGIAIWLGLLRRFVGHPPARDVFFVATSGHELGHLGFEDFLRRHSRLAQAQAWIHLGANFASRGARVRLQSSDEELRQVALAAMKKAGAPPSDETAPGVRPGGEARNIFDLGSGGKDARGRYVSLLGTNAWFHHPDDRWPATVDVDVAARLTQAMLEVADALAAP